MDAITPMSSDPAYGFGIILLLVTALVTYHHFQRPSAPYPPGPKGLPILGNALEFPREREWVTYAAWAEKYGRIVSVSALGTRVILLNDTKLEKELYDQRGAIYAERPVPPMISLMGLEWLVGLMKPNAQWKKCRKLFAVHFSKSEVYKFRPNQRREVSILLRKLLEQPENFYPFLHRFESAIILAALYGHQISVYEPDDLLALHDASLKLNHIAMAQEQIVNVFPSLRHMPKWFPGMRFFKVAQEARPLAKKILEEPIEQIKNDPTKFTPSFVSRAMGDIDYSDPDAEHLLKASAATLYNAGVDTSRALLISFILCMTLHPEAQLEAQLEIDSVTGGERLPDFDDKDQMPFLGALIKEVFRSHPVDPIGLPHKLVQDDIVDGYLLPKDSMVISNVWYMCHDSKIYSDPSVFRPERFLGEHPEPTYEMFGYGRRVCPGRYLAESNTWITIASILSVFDIGPEMVADGKSIPPVVEYQSGFISQPNPFKCAIKPRSGIHERLIRQAQLDL